MSVLRRLVLGVLLGASGTVLLAEADGPDFFRVAGLERGETLNIRAAAGVSSPVIGRLAADVDGLRNLGCRGGLSYAQWQAASADEREASKKTRWCQISYQGQTGWVAGWFLAEGSAGMRPSFACEEASGEVEKAICAEPSLAALDLELDRLYRLAAATPGLEQAQRDTLKATQRGWISGRDDCWKAKDDLQGCVAKSYVMRIDDLRTGYAEARSTDARGISAGPFAYVCDGFDPALSVVTFASDPGLLSIRWQEQWITPTRQPSASGGLYVDETADGAYSFFMKGQEARLTLPNGTAFACTQDEIG